MPFNVMKTKCDQCLYSKDRIVSKSRMQQIIKGVRRNDSYFICHKTKDVCCAGDFAVNGGGQLGRIAWRFNAIRFVEPPT